MRRAVAPLLVLALACVAVAQDADAPFTAKRVDAYLTARAALKEGESRAAFDAKTENRALRSKLIPLAQGLLGARIPAAKLDAVAKDHARRLDDAASAVAKARPGSAIAAVASAEAAARKERLAASLAATRAALDERAARAWANATQPDTDARREAMAAFDLAHRACSAARDLEFGRAVALDDAQGPYFDALEALQKSGGIPAGSKLAAALEELDRARKGVEDLELVDRMRRYAPDALDDESAVVAARLDQLRPLVVEGLPSEVAALLD